VSRQMVPRISDLNSDVTNTEVVQPRKASPRVGNRYRQQQLGVLSANRGGPTARQARQTRPVMRGFFVERSLIAERTAEALTELRRQRRPWNHAPFGWDVVSGRLVANRVEQGTLARIRQLRAAGVSYRKVAIVLDAEGRSTKRGGPWQAASVRSVLRTGALLSAETFEDRCLVLGGKPSRLRLDERRHRTGVGRTLPAATPLVTKRLVSEDRGGAGRVFDEQRSDRGLSGAGRAQENGSGPQAPAGQGADLVVPAPLGVKEPT